MNVSKKRVLEIIREEIHRYTMISERLDQAARGSSGETMTAEFSVEDDEISDSVANALSWDDANTALGTPSQNPGAKFRVKDADTGKEWTMIAGGGIRHADVEPATKSDAAIMRDVWGGNSWVRRGVIVKLPDGRLSAASLHNMPHAGRDDEEYLSVAADRSGGYASGTNYDYVKGNGVDGHMCLHFRGSTRHVDQKADSSAQAQIKRVASSESIESASDGDTWLS